MATRFTAFHFCQFLPISIEQCKTLVRRKIALVRKIVCGSGKAVYDADRMSQARRQEYRGDRKILIVANRHRDVFEGYSVVWADSIGVVRVESHPQHRETVRAAFQGFLKARREGGGEGGGIGRRTGFRFQRLTAWGFESLPSHQTCFRQTGTRTRSPLLSFPN